MPSNSSLHGFPPHTQRRQRRAARELQQLSRWNGPDDGGLTRGKHWQSLSLAIAQFGNLNRSMCRREFRREGVQEGWDCRREALPPVPPPSKLGNSRNWVAKYRDCTCNCVHAITCVGGWPRTLPPPTCTARADNLRVQCAPRWLPSASSGPTRRAPFMGFVHAARPVYIFEARCIRAPGRIHPGRIASGPDYVVEERRSRLLLQTRRSQSDRPRTRRR